jgi:hypothetical protein
MRTPMAVAAAAFTAAMVLVPMSAEATCTQVIYAERAISTANTTQLAGRTTSTSLIIWFGSTADDTLASLIHSAVAQRNRVQITEMRPKSGLHQRPETVAWEPLYL